MKRIFLLLVLMTICAHAQKEPEFHLNKLFPVKSSDYMLAFSKSYSKIGTTNERSKIIIVNSKTATSNVIQLPPNVRISNVDGDFITKFKGSRFFLVESTTETLKMSGKVPAYSNDLYLVSLDSFADIRLTQLVTPSWIIN